MIDRLHKMESIQGWFGEIFNFSPDPAQLPDPPANLSLSPGGAATSKKASTDDMLEQMSHLCVSVVKARDLPTMNSTGSLDPYVELKLGDFKTMTLQLKRNANPVWRQMFTFSAAHLQSNQLQIIVKYKDVHRDHFVGRVFFDMSDVPSRLLPDSRLAPQWFHLSDTNGENSHSLGEIMLAVWLGTQADKSYMEAWHSDARALSMGRITNTRSKVYYTPKLICLKVSVLAAQDLKGIEEDQPLGPTIAKIQMGSQIELTQTGQPQGSANQAWNEEFMFVVSEAFENPLVVTVVEKVSAGREEPIGRVIIPMSSPYELRNDDLGMSVPFEWFSLSRGVTGSKIQLRISLDTSYHVMAEWTDYMSDLHPPAAF